MPDPSAFLSTIAATSAAMVAIVGGLLVARFVSIDSEQEGAQRLVEDAQDRLSTARRRELTARDSLRAWYVDDFFSYKVIQAIGDGEQDVRNLRKIGDDTPLTDDELAEAIKAIVDEFAVARRTLPSLVAADTEDSVNPEWREFKQSHSSLPEITWDEAWDVAYEGIVRPPRPVPRPGPNAIWAGPGFDVSSLIPAISTPPEYVALGIQRRNALRDDVARAQQRVEDIEEELARLRRTRKAIVRPKGLGWGLVVLGFFTVVGVIIPIWLMSRAPERLTAHLGEVVFWLFFAGLLALLGYMTVLALRLSGWRKNAANHEEKEAADSAEHNR
jgi:hypothetical protein